MNRTQWETRSGNTLIQLEFPIDGAMLRVDLSDHPGHRVLITHQRTESDAVLGRYIDQIELRETLAFVRNLGAHFIFVVDDENLPETTAVFDIAMVDELEQVFEELLGPALSGPSPFEIVDE